MLRDVQRQEQGQKYTEYHADGCQKQHFFPGKTELLACDDRFNPDGFSSDD